jgi:hypothetical protein
MSEMNSIVKRGEQSLVKDELFYQPLFAQFDGGVHVAHLLPDSVHPV